MIAALPADFGIPDWVSVFLLLAAFIYFVTKLAAWFGRRDKESLASQRTAQNEVGEARRISALQELRSELAERRVRRMPPPSLHSDETPTQRWARLQALWAEEEER